MLIRVLACVAAFCLGTSLASAECLESGPRGSLNPEIASAAAREIAAHPKLYVNGMARLWRISKDHQDRGVLLGSMHLSYSWAGELPDAVLLELSKSSDVLGEIDLQSVTPKSFREFLAARRRSLESSDRHAAVERLDAALHGALRARLIRLGYSDAKYSQLTLLGVEQIVDSIPVCYENGLAAQRSQMIDIALEHRATMLHKRIIGIESLLGQWKVIGDPGEDALAAAITLKLRRESRRAELINFYLEAYAKGRVDLFSAAWRGWLADANESDAIRKYDAATVDPRNEALAGAIERQQASPGYHFAVVGAAHLIGEGGVIERMRRDGWQLDPVPEGGE